MSFHVRQKVVCVGWPWRGWRNWINEKLHPFKSPKLGDVLTICNIIQFSSPDEVSLEFFEFPSPETYHWDAGFLASGFRPIVSRKTDISAFKALLNPKNHKVPVE